MIHRARSRRSRTPRVVAGTALAVLLASAVTAVPAGAGGADVWTFPGTCPDEFLQHCVDGSGPGDTILIATNDPI